MAVSIKQKAKQITYHPKERMDFFRSLPVAEREAVFEFVSRYIQKEILDDLSDKEVVELLDQMDLQKAENALPLIKNARRRKKIIENLKKELKEKAEIFLSFHPKAALELLNFNYLFLSESLTIGEAADEIEEHYREKGKLPEVLVHKNGELCGEVPMSSLVREENSSKIKNYVVPIHAVSYKTEPSEIVNSFIKHKHAKIVVTDDDGSVIGIIYSDDATALFGGGLAQGLYNFAGVSGSERVFDGVFSKVAHRYKWLIINMATAFLAASVVGLFEGTLSKMVILAMYMPIVAGMGGNAATQTLAVCVRGIALGEVSLKNGASLVLREAGSGFINGVINGFIVFFIALFWNQNPMLGLVVGVSMVFNLVVAGFFGALIPLVMKSIGKDPAASATIFITTATDVLGFFCFLGLASLLLV